MSDQEKNVLTFFAAIVIIGVFGALIFVLLRRQEEQAFLNEFGEETYSLCSASIDDPQRNYRRMPVRGNRRVAVFESDAKSEWHDAVPDEFRAETREELTIVACVSDEFSVNLERCPYEANIYIDRYARSRLVTLYNAESGELITWFDVHGSPPTACEDITWAEVGEVKERRGGQPGDSNFIAALEVELNR